MKSMRHTIRDGLASLSVILSLAVPVESWSADAKECTNPAKPDQVLDCFSVDQSIPDTPGLFIVGLGTEDVIRPGTPRALGAALTNGVGQDGKPRSGVAIDFAPYKLLLPATTREKYKSGGWWIRPLWNTQISAGVGKATDSNDKSLRVGYGLHSILWRPDSSDPLLDQKHIACLSDALKAGLPEGMPALGGDAVKLPGIDKCYAALADRTWNATALTLSLATARVSDTGKWGDSKTGPRGAWLTLSYGFEEFSDSVLKDRTQLVITIRRLIDERIADPENDGAFVDQSSRLFGLKFRLRDKDRNYYLEHSQIKASISGRPADAYRRLAVGLEWRLADGVWLVAAVGGEGGRSAGKNSQFALTSVKFGSATESLLGSR